VKDEAQVQALRFRSGPPFVVLEGVGAFGGQEQQGTLEPVEGVWLQALVRLPNGLGVYVWLTDGYGVSAGGQVGGGRTGWRLPAAAVGFARCRLGLLPLKGCHCPCLRCARVRLRGDA
jgi:hypothetical protein